MAPEIDDMIADLKRHGWTAKTSTIWRAPNGSLHLGPAQAWRTMQRCRSVQDQKDFDNGRVALLRRSMRLRVEIEQIFTDCASWNANAKARKEGAEAVDCDPDGQLRRIANGIDSLLAHEAARS